eukprot:IDg14319t1
MQQEEGRTSARKLIWVWDYSKLHGPAVLYLEGHTAILRNVENQKVKLQVRLIFTGPFAPLTALPSIQSDFGIAVRNAKDRYKEAAGNRCYCRIK